jgi:hypothetical protein
VAGSRECRDIEGRRVDHRVGIHEQRVDRLRHGRGQGRYNPGGVAHLDGYERDAACPFDWGSLT